MIDPETQAYIAQQISQAQQDAKYDTTNSVYHTHNGIDSPKLDNSSLVAGVSSVTASGSGITASPTTGDVVIANTGVTSLSAGTNVTLSGSTGSVTISASSSGSSYKSGTDTWDGAAASGTQTIAHGLGKTPAYTRITAQDTGGTPWFYESIGVYNGSVVSNISSSIQVSVGGATTITGNMVYMFNNSGSNRQVADITVDATNITLTWTKIGTGVASTIYMLWEVQG